MILKNVAPKVSKVRLGALLLLVTAALPSLAAKTTLTMPKSNPPKVRIVMNNLSLSADELRKLKLDWKKMNAPLSLESQTSVEFPPRQGPPIPKNLKKKMSAKPTAAVLPRASLADLKSKHPEIKNLLGSPLILQSNTLFPLVNTTSVVVNGAVRTEDEHYFIRPRVNSKANSISLELEIKSPLSGKSGIVFDVRSGDSVLVRDHRGIQIIALEIAK